MKVIMRYYICVIILGCFLPFSVYACTNPVGAAGDMTFDTNSAAMVYCDGSNWIAMNGISLNTGLIGHWKMDDTSGNVIDSSGNGHTAIPGSAPLYEQTGVIGDSLYFSGEYLDAVDSDDWDLANRQATISVWFKADPVQPNSFPRFFDHYAGGGGGFGWHFSLHSAGEKLRFNHAGTDGAIIITADSYNDDQWHHALVTMDGSTARLYVDGVFDSSDTYSDLIENDQGLLIGGDVVNNHFVGNLDDLRIYHRVLSDLEISALYAIGTRDIRNGLVGHWKMDEVSGTVAADSALKGSNGTMNGGLSGTDTTTGVVGSALDFDGDDYISVGALPTLSTAYSMSLWVKLDRNNVEQRFTDVTTSTFTLRNRTTGAWNFHWALLGGGSSDSIGTTIGATGVWTHLAATHDGTTASLYINGVLDSSKVQTTHDFSGRTFTIGGLNVSHFTDGVIDDVRIYNRALTPEEITNLFNYRGCSSPLGDAGDIVYDSNTDVMTYCNGNSWVSMGEGTGAGGGCASPAGTAGEMVYDSNTDIMTYCDGSDWVGIGK